MLKYETLLAMISLALVYPLGVFTDNFSDFLLKSTNNKLRRKHGLEENGITVGKLKFQSKDENVSSYFNYARMRIRIARSTVFNFFFLTLSLTIFFLIRGAQVLVMSKWLAIIITILLGSFLTLYAYWSWRNIVDNYHRMAKIIWKEVFE